jgi:uncharacterized membrane protein YfcA
VPEGHQFASASGEKVPLVAAGLLAGLLAGLFGVGGGILLVPAFVLLLGMNQRLAHGTSLVAIGPIAVAGLAGYGLHGEVDVPAAVSISVGAMGGALAGTRLLGILPRRVLRLAFAATLLVTAVSLFLHVSAHGHRVALTPLLVLGLFSAGLLSGTAAGLLGVGGGIVIVPVLVLLFGLDATLAKGTSLATVIPAAVVGTVSNLRQHNADLRSGLVAGFSGTVGAIGGAELAQWIPERFSVALFAGLLLVVAFRLVRGLSQDLSQDPSQALVRGLSQDLSQDPNQDLRREPRSKIFSPEDPEPR